jgi:hypothetical protein
LTPLGADPDHLLYGKLGTHRPCRPLHHVPPGNGRHTIEYRAIDAAGNVGETKRFTVILRMSR